MKPITLKFCGINCFDSQQEIDFQNLGGVFGIFGPTGSGKTTILDAISIALFGETPRLGGKNYEFINNKQKVATVQLCFESEKTYTVKREYKLKNNNVESSAVLLQGQNTLAEGVRDVNAKIQDIIKMTAADYSKCIALPQGEFASFLKASAAERTALVGKLFGLEEYGDNLTKNANAKKAVLEQKCLFISQQISSLGSNIQQEISSLQNTEAETSAKIKESEFKLNELLQKQGQQQKQSTEFEKYNNLQKKLDELKSNQEVINKKKDILLSHNMATKKQPLLLQLNEQKAKLAQLNTNLKSATKEYELTNFDLQTQNKALEELNNRAKTIKSSEETLAKLQELLKQENSIAELNNDATATKIALKQKEDEIAKIDEEIKSKTDFCNADTARLNSLNEALDSANEKLSNIDSNGDMLKIELKREIFESVLKDATVAYENLQNQNSSLTEKISSRNKLISKNNQQINSILFSLCINGELDSTINQTQKLATDLNAAKKQIEFVNEQNQLIESETNNLQNKIAQASSEIEKFSNEISRFENLKKAHQTKIKEIEKERDQNFISNAEAIVAKETDIGSSCPICGNVVSQIYAQKSTNGSYYDNTLMLAKKEYEQLLAELKNAEIKKENAAFKKLNYEEEIKNLKASKLSLQKLQNSILVAFVDITENQLEAFENLIEKTNFDLQQLQNAKTNIEEIKSETTLLESQNQKDGIFVQKNKETCDLLFEYCEKLRKYIAENEFNLLEKSDYKADYKQIKQSIISKQSLIGKQIIALSKEIEHHKSTIEILKQKRQIETENVTLLNAKLAEIDAKNTSFKAQFELLCHGFNSVQEKIDKLLAAKDSLEGELAKTSENVKNLTIELLNAKHNLNIIQNTIEITSSTCQKLEFELKDVFNYFNTQNIDEILSYAVLDYKKIEKEVTDFEYDLQFLTNEIEKLEKPKNIDNCDYSSLILNENIAKNSYIESLGTIKEQIATKKQILVKQNELIAELEKEEKNLNTATELCSLLRGKELLAFAADTYLQEITINASNKLFSLLSGRYTLCYENKEFFVVDNYDNGIKRSCSTLSGGETFVVSLSLALSISESILSHAAQKSEFFFLDEGFGTLDASLRDTIVDSLVKLNENGITIGLITHVDELKSEIKNRLVVSRKFEPDGSAKSTICFEQDI